MLVHIFFADSMLGTERVPITNNNNAAQEDYFHQVKSVSNCSDSECSSSSSESSYINGEIEFPKKDDEVASSNGKFEISANDDYFVDRPLNNSDIGNLEEKDSERHPQFSDCTSFTQILDRLRYVTKKRKFNPRSYYDGKNGWRKKGFFVAQTFYPFIYTPIYVFFIV